MTYGTVSSPNDNGFISRFMYGSFWSYIDLTLRYINFVKIMKNFPRYNSNFSAEIIHTASHIDV